MESIRKKTSCSQFCSIYKLLCCLFWYLVLCTTCTSLKSNEMESLSDLPIHPMLW